eukprot:TRINITY_DN6054_c0_g1_i2.p2 TRINITY_DN6054_c0_g1~~TRINITY_DN6054_c0_g1_i2.p2  ORF type:complete len:347 (+),score=108.17 TRINITY_DN6054_c0_g1_i2:43-1041(+)
MDTDSESIPTSEEEEEVEVETTDYAEEMRKRLEAEREWQKGTGTPEEHVTKEKKDPFVMLPKRYQSVGSMNSSVSNKEEVLKDTAVTAQSPSPLERQEADDAYVEPVDEQPKSVPPPPRAEPKRTPADAAYDPLEDFNPSYLANLLEKDNERVYHSHMDDDHKFDIAQSVLEEMVESDQRLWEIQAAFKDKYCGVFEDVEENKLQYTDIHNEWVALMESYIERKLHHAIKNFSMDDFMNILQERANEVSGTMWTLLLTFTDFQTFKKEMLDHKFDMDEETDHVLSKRDYNKIINDAQTIMDDHFIAAARQRDALLAKKAVESGMVKAMDDLN